ncbi:aggregate spider glue 1 [Trichonephila clavata]|uniref:Aggregate spider glue 1 n=1 Tax=Trichonephila clavata TaxID=2740835 RepID=A0A8X6LDL3_TRICU|nr:aggregate spider glue 1 [Trichonephila clavata]
MYTHYFSIFIVIFTATLIGVEGTGKTDDSSRNEVQNIAIGDGSRRWPWDKEKTNFVCPLPFGVFSDITDCSYFFLCVAGVASRKKCQRAQQFDKYRKKCLPFIIAVCDKGDDDSSTKAPTTTTKKDGDDEKFTCPSLIGLFMHPKDCSKYYSCTFYLPTLKSCPDKQLFDGVKLSCKPAKDVHCGNRKRPDELTTPGETTVEIIPTEEPETPSPETEEPETPSPETEEPETPSPETEEPTTTPKPRVTAPETDCDEDDVDCIIDDLGETPDWFECPEDIGSYPHPSSKKLFIFCLNWKPSVKKCGQDLIFSEELMTCVQPY